MIKRGGMWACGSEAQRGGDTCILIADSHRWQQKPTQCVCVLSCLSHIWLLATPWTVACHGPLSMGFYRQKYWSGLPCSPLGDFAHPGIKPMSACVVSSIVGGFFTQWAIREDHQNNTVNQLSSNLKKKKKWELNAMQWSWIGSSTGKGRKTFIKVILRR